MLHLTNEQMERRNDLIGEARKLTGDTEAFNLKMKEIEEYTNQCEEENKNIANLNALKDNVKAFDLYNSGISNVKGKVIDTMNGATAEENYTNSIEYRKAFMNYVVSGKSIPVELKNIDEKTKTTDIGEVIPEVVLSRIIEKLESTGMILSLITRTNYKGGVSIPTSSVKPVATWVSEGSGSDKQKKSTDEITFTYYKLRCAVANTFETEVMALPVFETTLINNVVEAMTKAIEQAIIDGNGTGKPKGILKETATENIDIATGESIEYEILTKAEAALPLAYENQAVWFMTKKTFMAFIGMTDTTGQPIARVNYSINGKPERTLLGRKVILNDYMSSYADTVESATIIAFLFNPKDYILNTNYNMTIKRYEDNDNDDFITKAIMLVDGKVVDKNSFVTITKK